LKWRGPVFAPLALVTCLCQGYSMARQKISNTPSEL
jgi:hypothetical protein